MKSVTGALVMMQSEIWKAIGDYSGKAWAGIGPLVGVLIGAYISNRNQRKHWELDNKRAEYRKLLSTLADAGSKYAHFVLRRGISMAMIQEKERRAINVISNRLFIASEVEKLNILSRWKTAVSELEDTQNETVFRGHLNSMLDDIRRVALQDFS